jgi:hypothetical protein
VRLYGSDCHGDNFSMLNGGNPVDIWSEEGQDPGTTNYAMGSGNVILEYCASYVSPDMFRCGIFHPPRKYTA